MLVFLIKWQSDINVVSDVRLRSVEAWPDGLLSPAASELTANLFDSEPEFPSMLCFHEPCGLNWETTVKHYWVYWCLFGAALLLLFMK